LEAAIERLGLIGMFRIIDGCNDMPAAYMLSNLVISASTDPEGFGRVIVEAQAMGRPVIATDHGGARETIMPGLTGWLVPPGDPPALAETIREVLSLDGGERAAFARRAMSHIASSYTRDMMCARTIDVYEELLFPESAAAPVDHHIPLPIMA
jgi:glycosyltransferase involved in cell wall biosynthesis